MKCPFDDSPLQVVNRSGVEIDWCPTCKGVWLERGELDKLIEQAAAAVPETPPARVAAPVPPPPRSEPRRPDGDWDDDWDDGWREPRRDDRRDDGSYGKKRRSSFLSEIFDF